VVKVAQSNFEVHVTARCVAHKPYWTADYPSDRRFPAHLADLACTLQAYFAAGQMRAATALPNTVQQRLDRISTLLGDGWQQPDRALDLQVALRCRSRLRPVIRSYDTRRTNAAFCRPNDPFRHPFTRCDELRYSGILEAGASTAGGDRECLSPWASQGGGQMAVGRIITVFATKGGCGKTTVASNLAVTLCARGTRRVCLVDLDLEYGDVACVLGLRAQRSLKDAVHWAGDLALEQVASLMTPFRPNLDCLLAPTGPLPALYDFVVIDTPAQFSWVVLAALDAADRQVLVTTPERPALHNLRHTLDVLDLLYDAGDRSVVVNRSDARAGLSPADVDQLIRTPVAVGLPSWNDVPASINRGEPLAFAYPDHPVSQAIRRLAENLASSDERYRRDLPPG
jgi:MinD-like ATPase involved in chromosome partitioning or flagellar assembly